MMKGGAVIKTHLRSEFGNQVDFAQFTNKDGTLKGGVDVEVSNPQETQVVPVGGQRRMLSEKKRSAKWY
jgi:hypothetical protein